jgi:DNA helicase-2/ATP-dependent DNA helicase PcrA
MTMIDSSFDYLHALNPPQREAVEALDGPVLVLAGAGTGKTKALTTRLAHLLMHRGVSPMSILAVTFTNKAAAEMRHRVAAIIGREPEGWWLGTFHALAARILRRHADVVGLRDNFTILDADDQLRLIKQVMEGSGLDEQRWPPKAVLSLIQKWKDRGETPDRVTGMGGDPSDNRLLQIYAQYQDRLQTLNAADFGDLLLHNLTVFRKRPDILQQWQDRFTYLLVDEYQDTNVAQYLWLRLLAQKHHNLCCVGDDDQSIYGWRGAEVGNILRFEKDFPGAKIVRLEQNYRSTGHILAAASHLIAKNRERLGKTLWTDAEQGEKVIVRGLWDSEEEARWVGEEIEAAQRAGFALADMAILVRAGFQTREFEERLMTIGVPYRVIGGPRFYERQEIRDALAYLRVVFQPADDLAFERILNTPKRGIGPATVQQLHETARRLNSSLYEATARLVETEELKPKVRSTLRSFILDFERWRNQLAVTPHAQLAGIVLDESGYTTMWQQDKSPEAPGRLDNLKELVTAMAEFEHLGVFLEHVSLVMEQVEGAGDASVTLMTLHAAKGLEFKQVFLPGWEEGIFPSQRSLDESGERALQEERRLAYVGITRARQKALISFAARRRMRGQWEDCLPSRFVSELPKEHIDTQNSRGMYSGLGGGGRGLGMGGGSMPARSSWGSGWGNGWSGGGQVQTRSHGPSHNFGLNERIFHDKFGYGVITAIDGDTLTIDFALSDSKKVMAAYVRPVQKGE